MSPISRAVRRYLTWRVAQAFSLELLAEQGIPAIGIERNPAVVAWVRRHGWEVMAQDVLTFLEQPTETYAGVFCSHFPEHLPVAQVLRCLELIVPRVELAGTVVIVVPNPESIRMQLFGFRRDPEQVRCYHPELLEVVCRHAGLEVTYTNRTATPFAVAPLLFSQKVETAVEQSNP